MSVTYKVKVTVHSVMKGECPQGFKAGDCWLIENGETQTMKCYARTAWHSPDWL